MNHIVLQMWLLHVLPCCIQVQHKAVPQQE